MTLSLTIAVSLLILLSVFNTLYLWKKARFLSATIIQNKRELAQLIWDTEQLRAVVPAGTILPRPNCWSLSGDTLRVLVREVERRRSGLVVELGSGLSTIVLALKLKELGQGRVVAIDHDASYAEQTRSFLRLNDVDDIVELRIAPLTTSPESSDAPPWYESEVLEDLDAVDLLLVDGPPMPAHPEVRGAALPFFLPRMNGDWLLLLDDADRRGEQEILRTWQREHPNLEISLLKLQKTIATVAPAPEKLGEEAYAELS